MIDFFLKFKREKEREKNNNIMKGITPFIDHRSQAAARLDWRVIDGKTEIDHNLAAFKPANRVILASLEWLPRSLKLRSGVPCRGWAAKVSEAHPAWEVWRLNRSFMEARGFRAAKNAAGDWCLGFWIQDEVATAKFREASEKTTCELVVPVPEGLAFYPFQRAGVEFLDSRSVALLADEMGTGKTIQVAGLLNLRGSEYRRVLLITPASMKIIWARELAKWLVRKETPIMVIKGITPEADLPSQGIWIINYELLKKFRLSLIRDSWDLLVLDEAHYIKNRKSQRTKTAHLLSGCARQKLLLTGTPLLNRPEELWSLLHFLSPRDWPNFHSFAHRYCGPIRTEWGWDFSGASNLEELNGRLRAGLMMRRLKKDVLPQLPSFTRALVPLEISGRGNLDELVRLAGLDPFNLPDLLDPLTIPFECVAEVRHELGKLKVKPALQYILEQSEGYQEKIVVFAHHRAVLGELAKGLPGSVLVTGETDQASRLAAIEQFQNDPQIRFFVASIRAMGVGITLTAAARAIFVEQDWTPAILRQAEDRLHRIGQKAAVLSQYLVVPDSIDVNVMRAVMAKVEVIEKAVQ
jgi:SWI/SNF-related matrix-associated actin-dependent regulator 1 of chromatin subfamily A